MRILSERVSALHVSPIRRVAALLDEARERGDIISLGGGAPSLPPPQEVVDEFVRLVRENPLKTCGYTGTRGIPELRSLIAEDVKRYGAVDYDPQTEIIVTDGATEGIFTLMMSLISKGDEVIMTDPTYLGYREAVEMAGGSIRTIRVTVDEGYQPSEEHLKKLVSERTKLAIMLSPDNPTGRVLRAEFAKALVDLALDHDFWIISDDIYKHIIYEGEHIWISRLPGAHEHTIVVCSFSKEAAIPGLRLGYTLAPPAVIDAMEKMKQYTTLAPNSMGQFALLKFLSGGVKERYLRDVAIPNYRRKRDVMGRAIQTYLPEAKTNKPTGAFYYFVDMTNYLLKTKLNEEEFCSQLLRKRNVAAIPGGFFGEGGKQHIRLTFVKEPEERIEAGLRTISEFASGA